MHRRLALRLGIMDVAVEPADQLGALVGPLRPDRPLRRTCLRRMGRGARAGELLDAAGKVVEPVVDRGERARVRLLAGLRRLLLPLPLALLGGCGAGA